MSTDPNSPSMADFEVGRSAVKAFKRLSYSMWHALAEFVDNSTQSRINYGGIIDEVLANAGTTLKVEINYDKQNRTITIDDNSIGMTFDDLVNALKVAKPTQDSVGRSKYGMGMKTAACWIGEHWSITTCEWGSGVEWTAEVNVEEVCSGTGKIPLTSREVSSDSHYTKIKIWGLHRNIQKRTEEMISKYLGSMYRFDIREKRLILLFNGNPVVLPEEMDMAKYENGQEARETIDTTINGKKVTGWFGALQTGGRKYAGFSIFQNGRQIRGYPDGWKPKSVFGGEDDEGGNSLVSQRLIGELTLDGFEVSHTKDSILFSGTEEEDLELFLAEATKDIKTFATTMRKGSAKGTPWAKQKVQELVKGMQEEFSSPELKDAINTTTLPPMDVIVSSNRRQSQTVEPDEVVETWQIDGLTIRLCLQNRTENDPYLTIFPPSEGHLDIILNQQHPYYMDIVSTERVDELLRQYIYDGISEYFVQKRATPRIGPDAIRRQKDQLLRARLERLHNKNLDSQEQELEKLSDVKGAP